MRQGHETRLWFETVASSQRDRFVDREQGATTKDLSTEPYRSLVSEVAQRAKAAFGLDPAVSEYRNGQLAELECLKLGNGKHLISDCCLEVEWVHRKQGGCFTAVAEGECCSCCVAYIVSVLLPAPSDFFRAYAERERAARTAVLAAAPAVASESCRANGKRPRGA